MIESLREAEKGVLFPQTLCWVNNKKFFLVWQKPKAFKSLFWMNFFYWGPAGHILTEFIFFFTIRFRFYFASTYIMEFLDFDMQKFFHFLYKLNRTTNQLFRNHSRAWILFSLNWNAMGKGEKRHLSRNSESSQTWQLLSERILHQLRFSYTCLPCFATHSSPRQYLISLKAIHKRRKYFPLLRLQTTEIASGFVNTWH